MSIPIAATIRKSALSLPFLSSNKWIHLQDLIGDSEVVMIGEASHGTEEFYSLRAEITKMLIQEKGFNFVAVEGDWPAVYRLHRWTTGGKTIEDKTIDEAMEDFQRFPRWMWNNKVVADFACWLREFNAKKDEGPKVGFYGLDLYSLFESADAVIDYLENKVRDLNAATKARNLYGSLSQFRDEPSDYGASILMGESSREKEVCQVLQELLKKKIEYVTQKGFVDGEEFFYTQENAKVVKDAEEYYRNTYMGGVKTWNLRDKHMCSTLDAIINHYRERLMKKDSVALDRLRETARTMSIQEMQNILEKEGVSLKSVIEKKDLQSLLEKTLVAKEAKYKVKAVVWAHNSHLGDAKATAMSIRRELNLGQLVRERFGLTRSFNIGFTTYTGTVRAAKRWDGQDEVMSVNPALKGSYEDILHTAAYDKGAAGSDIAVDKDYQTQNTLECFGLGLRSNGSSKHLVSYDARKVLLEPRLERFIGVQYVKKTERESHYYSCNLPHQFDVVIHADTTSALKVGGANVKT